MNDASAIGFAALTAAYLALIKALHEKGVISFDEVRRELETTNDLAKAGFGHPKNDLIETMIDGLRLLADEAARKPPR